MSETIKLPGLVDPHVHFREPGTNDAETIESGTLAALIGGYALVADMPNNPGCPTWTMDRLREKQEIAIRPHGFGVCIPIAFYAGSQPEENNLNEFKALSKEAIGLKLYGAPTTGNINRYYAADFSEIVAEWDKNTIDRPILFHAGEDNLEDMIGLVARDNEHPLHVCHVNSPDQIELVSSAKRSGLPVTCGVCPHHLLKTSHDRKTEGKFAEMQPPLAHQTDAEKLMSLLADGEIDMIESDHAPHGYDSKMQAEINGGTCFGVPGIEHVVPLMLYQVKRGSLSIERLVDALSTQPAKLLGIKLGSETYTVWERRISRISSERDVESGAFWTPYLGNLTGGKLVESKIGGQTFFSRGKPIGQNPLRVIKNRGEEL